MADVSTPGHPVFLAQEEHRASDIQLRLADAITRFAGSMRFIYIHVIGFAIWCGTGLFGTDKFPFNFLTMSVSLEAIFLATFVMIGQNRQADIAAAKAAHDFLEQEQELKTNTSLTRDIHAIVTTVKANTDLLEEIHRHVTVPSPQAGHCPPGEGQ